MSRSRVLVVEDDESYKELYQTFFGRLHKEEFLWVHAPTGQRALLVLEKHPAPPVDIAVLDWKLSDMEGIQILKHIKRNAATRSIPIMMVTGMDSQKDAAMALELGAGDYIRKPFGNDEFLARLHLLLKRRNPSWQVRQTYELDSLALNAVSRQVTLHGKEIPLTGTEFDLMNLLLDRPDVTHSQGYLGGVLSSHSDDTSPEGVRKHVSNLRGKLGAWGDRIEAVRGMGYVLRTQFPVSP